MPLKVRSKSTDLSNKTEKKEIQLKDLPEIEFNKPKTPFELYFSEFQNYMDFDNNLKEVFEYKLHNGEHVILPKGFYESSEETVEILPVNETNINFMFNKIFHHLLTI